GGRIETKGSWSPASIITGPQYFDIFKYHWLVGNAKTALSEPYKVVLSEKKARLYFGNIPLEKMIGKKVVYQDSLQLNVSGNVKPSNNGSKLSMWLESITDIHFTKEFHRGDDGDDFRKAYMPVLYLLMGLAVFILLIAAINFINLSTAQSMQRVKEIGVRKVM